MSYNNNNISSRRGGADNTKVKGSQKTVVWNTDALGWPCAIARVTDFVGVQAVVNYARKYCQPEGEESY
jgi:hypothetical protein